MFEVVSGCLRLFQVVQLLRPVSNHVRLFEVDPSSAIVEVLMFVKPVSSHVRFFRALLDCFGHLGSNKLSKLFSAAMVRYLV